MSAAPTKTTLAILVPTKDLARKNACMTTLRQLSVSQSYPDFKIYLLNATGVQYFAEALPNRVIEVPVPVEGSQLPLGSLISRAISLLAAPYSAEENRVAYHADYCVVVPDDVIVHPNCLLLQMAYLTTQEASNKPGACVVLNSVVHFDLARLGGLVTKYNPLGLLETAIFPVKNSAGEPVVLQGNTPAELLASLEQVFPSDKRVVIDNTKKKLSVSPLLHCRLWHNLNSTPWEIYMNWGPCLVDDAGIVDIFGAEAVAYLRHYLNNYGYSLELWNKVRSMYLQQKTPLNGV